MQLYILVLATCGERHLVAIVIFNWISQVMGLGNLAQVKQHKHSPSTNVSNSWLKDMIKGAANC